MFTLIIIALAIFGMLSLPYSIRMAIVCSRIYSTFEKFGYPKMDITRLRINTGYDIETIVAACIADVRMQRVNDGNFEVWEMAQQYRRKL